MSLTPDWAAVDDETLIALHVRAQAVAAKIVGVQSAPDIASEVIIRALIRWRTVHDHAMQWVTVAATNLSIDSLRKRSRLVPTTTGADPADAAVDRVDLVNELRRLPRRQQQAIVLHHLVGLSDDEVAETLGVSVATTKTHLVRGMASLRKVFSTQEPDHVP